MIIHAFGEMAERAHYRAYAAFGKFDLPYMAIETGPVEDWIFNGENLLHFIGARIIRIDLFAFRFWPVGFTAIVRGISATSPLTWIKGLRYKTMDWNA